MSKWSERAERNRETAVEEQVYGTIFEAARTMPCVLRGHRGHKCHGPVTGHHLKSVGSGGVDFMNVVSVCTALHWLLHGMDNMTQNRVEVFFDVDLGEHAKSLTLRVIGGHETDLDY